MRFVHFGRHGMFILCLLTVVLSGCFGTSQQSRFYTLNSLRGPEAISNATSTYSGVIVAVGPLAIPDYLDRPEIVTRAGQNEMRINEFQRWAGSFEANMSSTVVEDLSVLLPSDRFSVIRWAPAAQRGVSISYRVMVDVMRFDSTPGGAVFLEADWTVFGKEKDILLAKKSSISGKANGTDFADLVAAMSKAVEDLCREIAAGVTSMEQKTPGK